MITDISNSNTVKDDNLINVKMIEMVMRQTEYTYDEAKKELEEYNWNYEKVIRKFMGIEEKTEKKCKTVNQEIFKQIRNHMDAASNNFYK